MPLPCGVMEIVQSLPQVKNTMAVTVRQSKISSEVKQIQSTERAFAAILEDGSVVTCGEEFYGGDSSAVRDQLRSSGVYTADSSR